MQNQKIDTKNANKQVIKLAEVDSTNKFASTLSDQNSIGEGTIVVADFQTQGRGQKGKNWESHSGKNLLVSFIYFPSFLSIQDQFLLSKWVALAVQKTVAHFTKSEASIKWPNDIYIGPEKLAGLLLENSISGGKIKSCIAGIGLNVNQTEFDASLNATSLKTITGNDFVLDDVLNYLDEQMQHFYFLLQSGKHSILDEMYLEKLYKRNVSSKFIYRDEIITAKIEMVDKSGKLILEKENGEKITADLQQISFVHEA